jgi:hypothetical protein
MNIFLNAKKWTKETSNDIGIPRPIFSVPSHALKKSSTSTLISNTKIYLHKKIPVPWQSEPVFNGYQQLSLNIENEEKVYKEGRCAYCGIYFNDEDNTIRWKTLRGTPNPVGPNVLSDNYPFHIECMKQARRFCPFMRTTKDKEFEFGDYKTLKDNALNFIKKYI